MKKILRMSVAVLSILILTAGIANNVQAQAEQKDSIQSMQKDSIQGNIIPADVMKIIKKTCVKCHTDPGKTMPLSHLNLSKWDQYSVDKQANKAQAMCKEMTEIKMPPKSYREDHPDDMPTAEEIKMICDWAQSVQPPQK